MEVSTSSATEKDFRSQKANIRRGSTSGQTWETDVGKKWLSTQHQATGKQVASDPRERNATKNYGRPWWVAVETMKVMEDCLKKLDRGVSQKLCKWATQQKAWINKLELGNQLKGTWQSLLREYFEEAMRTPSSTLPLMPNPYVRTAGQLMFAWSPVGIELEVLISTINGSWIPGDLRFINCWCLFLEVDNVSDDRQHRPNESSKGVQKVTRSKNYAKENIHGNPESVPEYWNRKGRWLQTVSRESRET